MISQRTEVGNVVRLNSGSPDLRVIALDGPKKNIAVEWIREGLAERAVFPIVCVRPAR